MQLVDIHTHNSSAQPNVITVRNLSIPEAEQVIASEEPVLFSAGIHPWHAHTYSDTLFEKLAKIFCDKRAVLIGECGLDRNIETPLDKQMEVFLKHIALSESVKKPLIIHCVGYFNELLQLRKELKPAQRWIIHGFRGKPQLAAQILKAECDLSFGYNFNPESVEITPLEHIFIETDENTAPISDTYNRVAKIKNCRIEDLNAGNTLLNHNDLELRDGSS